MKRKKHYTFIISENSSSNLKTITVEKKYIYLFFGVFCSLFLLLTAFLTDYLALYVDKWKLSQLQKENSQLKKQFGYVDKKLKDLEKRVYKISDFSKRLQLITNASPEQINQQMGFGKIHSSSAIVALSENSPPSRGLSSLGKVEETPFKQQEDSDLSINDFAFRDELEFRIEQLTGKSELVKQDAWTLYTDLLEKQELLNSTPSISPVKGWVSSVFGYRNETIYEDHTPDLHHGIDIAAAEGTPVVATADGKVFRTGYNKNYGNFVIIDHGYGLKTYYAHLSEIKTKKNHYAQGGEVYVQRGEVIALVGSTGKSTGPHLHYEIRIFGVPVNPDNYILDQVAFTH